MIFDEAHQLPETASLFFGESVSTSQLIELARDTRLESAAAAKDYAPLPEAAQALDKAARDLRLAFTEDSGRIPARMLDGDAGFRGGARLRCSGALDTLAGELKEQAERSEGLMRCWQRALSLAEQLERWRSGVDEARVHWVELFGHSLQLQLDAALDRGDLSQRRSRTTRGRGSSPPRRCR